MAGIEGVIILSPSNEPILTSHFTHPLDNYAALHIDQLVARLGDHADAAAGEHDFKESGWNKQKRVFATGEALGLLTVGKVLPITNTSNIPAVKPVAGDEADEDEASTERDPGAGDESEKDGAQSQSAQATSAASHSAVLVHIERNALRFVAVLGKRGEPLLPIVFLQALITNAEKYLGAPLTEDAVRENFDIVYQLIEEMLDESGQPLHTEYNTLRELVREPSWIDDIVARLGAASSLTNAALGNAMSAPQLPSMPWRRPPGASLRAMRNEAYFDIIETISGVFSRGKSAHLLGSLTVRSRIEGNCKLAGTPELLIRLSGAHKDIVDASLHPCVRTRAWKKERSLSFVPPDQDFTLADFGIGSEANTEKHVPVKLSVTRSHHAEEGTSFRIAVSCQQDLDDVEVLFAIGDRSATVETTLTGGTRPGLASEDLNAVRGTFHHSAKTGMARWHVPRLTREQRALELAGTIKSDEGPRLSTAVTCRFSLPNASVTSLKIASVEVIGDAQHKTMKGVRSLLRGDLDWRW